MNRPLLAIALMATLQSGAMAQVYPTRPVTMVVPFPAGGPSDVVPRILGDRLRATLGQSIVVENVAGAGGSIGMGRVARAAPDGYTVGVGSWSTGVVNGVIYNLTYDVLGDFEPVVLLPENPLFITSKKADSGAKPRRADRLGEGGHGAGPGGHLRRRHLAARRGRHAAASHRSADPARALSRRRPGVAGPDLRDRST